VNRSVSLCCRKSERFPLRCAHVSLGRMLAEMGVNLIGGGRAVLSIMLSHASRIDCIPHVRPAWLATTMRESEQRAINLLCGISGRRACFEATAFETGAVF
jgi:hypothetical protein